MALHNYQLDPAHFYTTPGLTFQACLKHTRVDLELLTNIDMLLMIESGIRGGTSYIAKSESVANNKCVGDDTYDLAQPSKFITYLDANNLDGWAMSQPLPVGGYRWLSEDEAQQLDVMTVPDDAEVGYILEVDLAYPDHLHDVHYCYPLAPEHMVITAAHLSPTAKELLETGSKYRSKSSFPT